MPSFPEVTAPFNTSRNLRRTKMHHSRRMPIDVVHRDGVPTMPLARTIVDLADLVSEAQLYSAFDSAHRKFRGLPAELDAELASNATGRKGRHALMAMVRRARGESPTDSPLEARAALAMDKFGLPSPQRQYEIRDPRGEFIARVDFAWPVQPVVLQCDSRQWHLAPHQFEKDLRQRRQLESHGWSVVHVTWSMLASSEWLTDLAQMLELQRGFPWKL